MLLTFEDKCSKIEGILKEYQPSSDPRVGKLPDDEGLFCYDLIIVGVDCFNDDIVNYYECFSSIEGELDRSGLTVDVSIYLKMASVDFVSLYFIIGVYEDTKHRGEEEGFNKILDTIEKKIGEFL